MLERGFDTLIKNVWFSSPTDMGSHMKAPKYMSRREYNKSKVLVSYMIGFGSVSMLLIMPTICLMRMQVYVWSYRRYEAIVYFIGICGNKSVISFIEYIINRSEEVNSRLQFHLRIIGLCFCGNKSNEFSFWSNVVCIWATEEVPANKRKGNQLITIWDFLKKNLTETGLIHVI